MDTQTHSLIDFLQADLALPAEAIALALQQCEQIPAQLPMILWQYGFVTLAQLDRIFDWLETTISMASVVPQRAIATTAPQAATG